MKYCPFVVAGFAAALLAACGTPSSRQSVSLVAPIVANGGLLTATNGMTLYTYDKDVADAGKSVCTGQCAANWPPLLASERDTGAGNYRILIRDNGRKQWAYKGKPLYFWSKDQKPGDKTGDGINNVWHIARP